ncbi:hypothetical protein KVR01_000591 [Diaporthe batatas]|uniref:uncharacterized protein n=1 Tax=Diaporthe batatas TaxID=748121 RepID=UPI001D03772E|nr:uncharacterized protein KVR01_000591 [Diaporthe batatas]KAG8169846.1 hypothetical protein KVR01_000591 [Diaporthe batatas]
MRNAGYGAQAQANIHPDDFHNDAEASPKQPVSRQIPQDSFKKEHILQSLKERSLGGLVRELMLQMLWRSSAVFSTTHVGAGQLVKKFTKVANEYILDEAAAATIPEAAQIWRNDRPLILGGDPFQLLPATLSAGTKYQGTDHTINPLAPQHKLSLLRLAMLNGWPCLVLRYQRRMVLGLFDLFGVGCVLEHHPAARRCEDWVVRKLDVRASPNGRVLPVFVHVRNSEVRFADISRSRSNPRMLQVLIRVLNRLIQGARLDPNQIAIITPYTAQENAILQAVGHRLISVSDNPKKMLLTTADRSQGNERDVVIFLLVNTRQSDSGLLWDENRMNVISTRARDFMIVIGDIGVDQKTPSANVKLASGRVSGENKLPQWLRFFQDHGRVANMSGSQKTLLQRGL